MPIQRRLQVVDAATDEVFMDQAFKVAFATNDVKSVNQHFGSAESFAIFAVGPGESKLLEVCQFGALAKDGDEGKLTAKFDALRDCLAVYSAAVGPSAIAQLKTLGVHPMKVEAGVDIGLLIAGLQRDMTAGGAGWLRQAMQQRSRSESRFDQMEAEGWEE